MLCAYIKEVAPYRGEEYECMHIVLQSLAFMEKKGLKPIRIFPRMGHEAVEVSVDNLRRLKAEVANLLQTTRL
jgi:hypothetical protein